VVDAIERALGGEAKSSDLRRMITAARRHQRLED